MKTLGRKLSKAFWPNPEENESADTVSGNAAVDKLTLGQLAKFYAETQTGPTYVMVSRRVQELLKMLPPHIENRKERAITAIHAAELALISLGEAVKEAGLNPKS